MFALYSTLYRGAICAYGATVRVASLFSEKAHLFTEGRAEWREKLKQQLHNRRQVPLAWFHVSSLGEFEQARPLLEAFRVQYPQYQVLLTFFSPSGYEVRKNYAGADWVTYLPLDTAANARFFIETVNPTLVFWTKYDFFYFYFKTLAEKKIPLLCFSVILRPEQKIFHPILGKVQRATLRKATHFFTQNQTTNQLLQKINISQTTLAGDTRFDRVRSIEAQRKEIPTIEFFAGQQKLLVLGSTWSEDIELLQEFLQNFQEPLKIVIAPHQIGESHLREVEKALPPKWLIRFSDALQKKPTELEKYQILLIDNMGMLSSIYAYADLAYVGGGLRTGLHNILEVAVFGIPIFFGNQQYAKFQEAQDLLAQEAAFAVGKGQQMAEIFRRLYQDEVLRRTTGEKARRYVLENCGATEKILDFWARQQPYV
ncbi:3-deoxy-D-manno-octulosonic acid transferase [Hugenholtzia roseola]|uniref:3-deoxy-D-manno-octulosonic acid transferase n=1 Tax=Hugenholtzia roseola TaxID=1002 RepID=UPI00040F9F73|nr:glycosyltransferase N-terminal domain-containing protein [Hugenholtzia roseola]